MAIPTQWLGKFQVNTGQAAGGTQDHPQTIGLSNGNFLIVWQEDGSGVGTMAGVDIIGKIFDVEGNLVRESFQLNTLEQLVYFTTTGGGLDQMDVAATADGGFVLTYRSAAGNQISDSEIYWERFDADGDNIDATRVAGVVDDDNLYDPRIAFDLVTGTSMITFTYREGGLSESYYINAVPVSGGGDVGTRRRLAVLDEEGDPGHNGSLAVLANGNFVAVYSEADSDAPRPQASIFTATGDLVVTVGVSNDVSNYGIKVASLADGGWVAVWDVDASGDSAAIRYRVYAADGTPRTTEKTAFQEALNPGDPDVVALPNGDFVITWDSQLAGIRGLRFKADGRRDGNPFDVSLAPGATPDVGVTGDGRLLFAWDGEAANTISASIWDPRADQIAGFNYQTGARNFVDTPVITSRRDGALLFGSLDTFTILGQEGDDTVVGLSGAERILGRGGVDSIQAGMGADYVDGGDGDDIIEGGQGSDVLIGGAGRDTVSYRNSSAAVSVTINGDINANNGGDAVADELFAFEVLIGSAFDDTLRAQGGQTTAGFTLGGGAGNDTIVGGGSSQTGGGNDTLFGEAGNDTISGGIGADTIDGGADDDILNGNAGNDIVRGGRGNDTLSGGASGFGLFGAGGNDQLFGDDGTDTLNGDVGNDVLHGGQGADALNGGTGTDWADYSTALERVTVALSAPSGNTGDARGDTYVSIENLRGTGFADFLNGDEFANRIEGLAGDDSIAGREGNDTLAGGAGKDTLIGGPGADDFFLASRDPLDADRIRDFTPGEDRIALDGLVFGLPAGALAPERFALGSAKDSDDRLIYNADTGKVFFDADGKGGEARVMIATLIGAPMIDAGDFIVIGGASARAPSGESLFDQVMSATPMVLGFHCFEP